MKCSRCQKDNPPQATFCAQCGHLLSTPIDTERIRAQLKKWQERLLDLTKANPLLGINRSRVSKLRVIEPGSHALFRDFVIDERTLKMPRVMKVTRGTSPDEIDEGPTEPEYQLEPGDLMFEANPAELMRRLRRIYDNARTTVEERGVTTLHLSFGVLKWDDPMLGESISPLWLVPCELESFGPNAPLRLALADEEMQLNPALELYLRERHRITLSALPDELAAEALPAFLEDVRVAIREQRWKAEDEVWLSTYSFESLVLYQDLRTMADLALTNEIVAALAGATPLPEGSEALGEEHLDTALTPDTVPVPVLPTDSSQLKALAMARTDRHLVVHGPPGTGKSQTIANLIADALGQNKKVLFVSAKMAALNVVHDRLTKIGLERFCLEAHSTKAGKAKIIEELKRTLAAAHHADEDFLDERLEDVLRIRDDLNTYVREFHERRKPLGLTAYQAIGKVEKLRKEADVRAPLPWDDPLKVTRSELNTVLDALRDLGAQAEVFDQRASHPWRGFTIRPGTPVRQENIEADLLTIRDALTKLHSHLTGLTPFLGSALGTLTLNTISPLAPAFSALATLDRLPPAWTTRETEELLSTAMLLDSAAANALELQSKRAEHERTFKIPAEETLRLLAQVETQFKGWIRTLRLSYWRWRKSVRQHLKDGAARDFSALQLYFAVVRRVYELDKWFEKHSDLIEREVGVARTPEPDALTAAAKRLQVAAQVRTALLTNGLSIPEGSPPLTQDLRQHAASMTTIVQNRALGDGILRVSEAWPSGFTDRISLDAAPISAVLARCQEVPAALPRMQEWVVLQHTLEKCRELGLMRFIQVLGSLTARAAPEAFERRFYTAWTNCLLETSPTLAVFAGVRREDQIERFRALDAKIRAAALSRSKLMASEAARRVAAAQSGVGTASEIGILRRELEKRRRIKPLRKLFAEIPNVLQALKPCMLMSPLSVSTFLKPGTISFDLVVFDEASQLPTQESIPAILRAKQVVVAGDQNQLPPTSFFMASVIFDESSGEWDKSEELEPLESLLDDCVRIYPVFDQSHLRWHYRSKDERLIKFSNYYFYRNTGKPLITFPSVSTSPFDRGVRLDYVPDGLWDRGGSQTNRAEARRVAQLVVEQLDRYPERSMGVVAMNVKQREAIEEARDELILERPDLAPLLDKNRPEAFFIKALETVQGDERDTMIISVGYGRKDPNGAPAFNFGPLNQEGGWRRLNVLVTRARWQTILVTSMRSHELGGVNPNNRGAVALRNFIAYAEQGGELPPEPTVRTAAETNDFEDAVAEALREHGCVVDQQVGTSEYRIDLVVRDPRDPHRYMLGIESDGATYHSAKTARDRDLLRQQVLREQGWRLYRIWSTDWFRDRDKALAGVLRAIERVRQTSLDESVPAPPPSSTAPPGASTTHDGVSQAERTDTRPAPISRRYKPGEPYQKHRETGNRDLLLEREQVSRLANQVMRVVDFEGPIHKDLLTERLKEINNVARAGPNVQANVDRAIQIAVRAGRLTRTHGDFLTRQGSSLSTFRIPGDGVERPPPLIPPEEIGLAVLYVVEDQFGYQRDALPKKVGELFGFERTPAGLAELVRIVVDDLVEKKQLVVSGHYVYIA